MNSVLNEEELRAIEARREQNRTKLKVGGGTLAALGGLGAGSSAAALKLNDKVEKLIKEGKYLDSPLAKLGLGKNPLTPAQIDMIKQAKKIGIGMGIVGGLSYGGVKAYEHFKDKKKREEKEGE